MQKNKYSTNLSVKVSMSEYEKLTELSRKNRVKMAPLVRELIFHNLDKIENITFLNYENMVGSTLLSFSVTDEQHQLITDLAFDNKTSNTNFMRCILQKAMEVE